MQNLNKMIIQNENDIKQTLHNSHKFKYFLQTSFSVSPFICLASLLTAGSCFYNNIRKAFCQKKKKKHKQYVSILIQSMFLWNRTY